MMEAGQQLQPPQLFYRITALWVLCEAFAGGFLHAAKIPFAGMMVSSLAVCCIAMLAWYSGGKGTIIKATIIVAIFKLLLSPHSPPTAYLAVFFQGAIGQLFLGNKKYFKPAVILVAVLSLAESAMQRLLVLWFVYGESFWTALDKFIQKITGEKTVTNYSLWIAAGYVFIHMLAGFIAGSWISSFLTKIKSWKDNHPQFAFQATATGELPRAGLPKKKKKRLFLKIFIASLLFFYLLTIIKPEWAPLPGGKIAPIFLRAVVILLAWYFLLGPLIMRFIKNRLLQQQALHKAAIENTMAVLPEMKTIFTLAWKASAQRSGLRRIQLFAHIVLANTLNS